MALAFATAENLKYCLDCGLLGLSPYAAIRGCPERVLTAGAVATLVPNPGAS